MPILLRIFFLNLFIVFILLIPFLFLLITDPNPNSIKDNAPNVEPSAFHIPLLEEASLLDVAPILGKFSSYAIDTVLVG